MMANDHSFILQQMGITQWVLREPLGSKKALREEQVEQISTQKLEPKLQNKDRQVKGSELDIDHASCEVASPSEFTLNSLRKTVSKCTRCALGKSRIQTVFGEGPDQADWLFIGEAPGQHEDKQGKPFIGRAGQLLTQMVRALGLSREQVYIVNMLKCRPPGNRDPSKQELQACEPYLLQQIQLIQPKVIVALGRISAQALLKSDQPLGQLRGATHHYGPDKTPLVATYHPAYLLRSPADKDKSWSDLLLAHQQVLV